MKRFANSQAPNTVPIEATLFTKGIIEEMAGEVRNASPTSVLRSLGIEAPQITPLGATAPADSFGAATSLKYRADDVESIMTAHNASAELQGLKKHRAFGPNNTFDQRYSDPDRVYEDKEYKEYGLRGASQAALERLAGRASLLAAGFSEDVATVAYRHVQRQAANFMPGAVVNSDDRKKALDRVKGTADRSTHNA